MAINYDSPLTRAIIERTNYAGALRLASGLGFVCHVETTRHDYKSALVLLRFYHSTVKHERISAWVQFDHLANVTGYDPLDVSISLSKRLQGFSPSVESLRDALRIVSTGGDIEHVTV